MAKLVRDNLVRAVHPGIEVRADENGGGDGTRFTSRFAVYNTWTEINSVFEGRFLERFAVGSFKKSMRDRFQSIKVTLNHGQDPQLGDKPIVDLDTLRDEPEGPVGEGRLLDGLPELVLDGLRSGQYGASHRFSILREDVNQEPPKSAYNPEGIPERTVIEARLYEFGPVTFPAYPEATAGVRSLTDEVRRFTLDELVAELRSNEDEATRVLALLARTPDLSQDPAPNVTARAESSEAPADADAAPDGGTSGPERRQPRTRNLYGLDGHTDPRPDWAL